MKKFRYEGRSGDSINPESGNSALEGLHDVISALRKWRDELQSEFINEDFQIPVPTMNFGRIHGGDSPNHSCAGCTLSLDLRMLPGMKLQELNDKLRNKVKDTLAASGLKVEFNAMSDGIPPMQTSGNK